MYNVANKDGRVMLGANVPSLKMAVAYRDRYAATDGKPYPNGRGFYPLMGWCVIDARYLKVFIMGETVLSPAELKLRKLDPQP